MLLTALFLSFEQHGYVCFEGPSGGEERERKLG